MKIIAKSQLIHVVHRDINRIVFDYLVNQGYPDAARKFAVEAKIAPIEHQKVDVETIEERVEIRNAILSGDIPAAISKINDLDPEVSDYSDSDPIPSQCYD